MTPHDVNSSIRTMKDRVLDYLLDEFSADVGALAAYSSAEVTPARDRSIGSQDHTSNDDISGIRATVTGLRENDEAVSSRLIEAISKAEPEKILPPQPVRYTDQVFVTNSSGPNAIRSRYVQEQQLFHLWPTLIVDLSECLVSDDAPQVPVQEIVTDAEICTDWSQALIRLCAGLPTWFRLQPSPEQEMRSVDVADALLCMAGWQMSVAQAFLAGAHDIKNHQRGEGKALKSISIIYGADATQLVNHDVVNIIFGENKLTSQRRAARAVTWSITRRPFNLPLLALSSNHGPVMETST